jgi:hypothetical protein
MRKKVERQEANDQLRREYDLSELKGEVRGKICGTLSKGHKSRAAIAGRGQILP